MTEAVDYAFTNPSPAGLYAAGKRGAGRYVGPGTSGKHLTAAERDALFAAGLDIFLLVEGSADSALGGRTVGVQHGQQALAAAAALGAPATAALYAAVDFDVTAVQWPTVVAYFQGYISVVGLKRSGIYGSYRAMAWAARDHIATWFFQTYAWSAQQWYSGNHVEQYHNGVTVAGGVVDLCRIKQTNYGQWSKAGGDDMTPEQAAQLSACQTILDGLARGLDEVWITVAPYPDKDGKLSLAPFWDKLATEVVNRLPAGGGGGSAGATITLTFPETQITGTATP